MNGKLSRALSGIFLVVFTCLFFALFVGAVINIDKDLLSGYARYALPLAVVFGLLVLLYGWAVRRWEPWLSAHYRTIVIVSCAVFFVMQLIFAYLLEFDGMYDIINIHTGALDIARDGALSEKTALYARSFPSTVSSMLWLALAAKLPLALGINVKWFWMVLLCLRTAACLPMVLYIARRRLGVRAAYTVLLFWMLSLPILLNSASVYTHMISFPYTTLLFFLYEFLKSNPTRRNALLCLPATVYAVAVGTLVMRVTAVAAVALLIDGLLRARRGKERACLAAAFALCAAVALGSSALIDGLALDRAAGDAQPSAPFELWTVVALNEETLGRYSAGDRSEVMQYPNYEEREAAAKELISERIAAFGPAGLAAHLYKKTIVEMASGCFLCEDLVFENPVRASEIHRYAAITGDRIMITRTVEQAGYLVVLALLIFNAAMSLRDDERPLLAVYISLFGLVLATLFYETNPRHIISFLPLMYVAAAAGLERLRKLLCAVRSAKKLKLKATK